MNESSNSPVNVTQASKKKTTAVQERWTKPRHRFYRAVYLPPVRLLCKLLYRIRITPVADTRQYLILANHQTPFDQFFLEIAFRNPLYFLATEDIFSNGWISRVISHLCAPIPICKTVTDLRAVRICHRVGREGGSIAIFPEGNRTYSGKTETINPSIVSFVRLLKLPLVLFRLEGGYGKQPRWSDVRRGGSMCAYPARILEPEEYKTMDDDALYRVICEALFVNDTAESRANPSRRSAEYLERLLFVCPTCGMTDFVSRGNVCTCQTCRLTFRYEADCTLTPLKGALPFTRVNDWYEYQNQWIRHLDLSARGDGEWHNDTVSLYSVAVYRSKKRIAKKAQLRLYRDRLEISDGQEGLSLAFAEIGAMRVLGHNKLAIQHGDRLYQVKGNKRFNAVRYMYVYYHARHLLTLKDGEDTHDEFLGL